MGDVLQPNAEIKLRHVGARPASRRGRGRGPGSRRFPGRRAHSAWRLGSWSRCSGNSGVTIMGYHSCLWLDFVSRRICRHRYSRHGPAGGSNQRGPGRWVCAPVIRLDIIRSDPAGHHGWGGRWMRCGRRPGFRGDPPISGPTGAGPVSGGVHSTGGCCLPAYRRVWPSTSAGMPSAASRMGVEALLGAFPGKGGGPGIAENPVKSPI